MRDFAGNNWKFTKMDCANYEDENGNRKPIKAKMFLEPKIKMEDLK